MTRTQHEDVQPTQAREQQEQALEEPLLLRVEEVARLLSLSRSLVYQMLDSGELRSVRRGTARRVLRTSVYEWVAKQAKQEST